MSAEVVDALRLQMAARIEYVLATGKQPPEPEPRPQTRDCDYLGALIVGAMLF